MRKRPFTVSTSVEPDVYHALSYRASQQAVSISQLLRELIYSQVGDIIFEESDIIDAAAKPSPERLPAPEQQMQDEHKRILDEIAAVSRQLLDAFLEPERAAALRERMDTLRQRLAELNDSSQRR